MKNLIKNVVRSFKKNKISIIGLIFLLFFGLGVFCLMSNTTNNIKNEYTSLARKGKLHDFTAAELYDVGNASYAPHTKGIVFTRTGGTIDWAAAQEIDDLSQYTGQHLTITDLYRGAGVLPEEDGTYAVPLPEQEWIGPSQEEAWLDLESSITIIETYHFVLDAQTSTGLYHDYALSESQCIDFNVRITHRYNPELLTPAIYNMPENILVWDADVPYWGSLSSGAKEALCIGNTETRTGCLFNSDYGEVINGVNDQTQIIYNEMTTTNTNLVRHIDDKYSKEVDHRYFKSINITGTKDNIFYKVIDSNPSDTIDTMVLFKDPVNRTGNQLFSVSDWAPYNSQIKFFNLQGQELTPGSKVEGTGADVLYVPTDFNDVVGNNIYHINHFGSWTDDAKYVYSQIMQVRFKRMLSGDMLDPDIKALLKVVAGINLNSKSYFSELFTTGSDIYNAYETYVSDWHLSYAESITISANGNVVFTWYPLGTPQTCTISNWTSRFSIVNPQHLAKNKKGVITPSQLNDFAPYKEWYKATYGSYPSGELDQKRSAAWFNSLNSEQFGFWLDPSTKAEWTTMSYDIPGWDDPLIIARGKETGQWNGVSKKHIASCGGFNEIIWGCGLTPDFMYPVVDLSRPTPNTKTECLVYCNESGYNSIKLAFITATVEEYLLARFKPNVNTNRRHEIVNEINTWSREEESGMILPEGIKCAYFADDTSNVLNCSGFRIAYIPHLVDMIETVSTVLCVFIGILCLIICFVIIKRYVEGNRVNIGIMRANGIKKSRIGLSLLPFALFPAIVGGVAAYITGLLLQAAALSLFSNYWMLPTPLIKFDWVSFLACIFVPFIVFSVICFVTTMLVLRVRTVDLMKPGSEFKTNAFSRVVKKPFKHFGIMTRFRVSLAFNSITRLLMLAAMSCLTMSSLVFAFTTFDKLNKSRETNSSQFKYSFNLELTTPTSSGSVFSVYDYYKDSETKGFGYSDPSNYLFNTSWDTTAWTGDKPEWGTNKGVDSYQELTKWYSDATISNTPFGRWYKDAVGANGNLMLPTIADSAGQEQDLMYLQGKLCSRLTLDHIIGVPGIAASNPWEIALALMPANSRNIAAEDFNNIINAVGQKIEDANKTFIAKAKNAGFTVLDEATGSIAYQTGRESEVRQLAQESGVWFKYNLFYTLLGTPDYWGNWFSSFVVKNEEGTGYVFVDDITKIGTLFMGFNEGFIDFIKLIYTDPDLMRMEYPITYGSVPLNWGITEGEDIKLDETYTYINGEMNKRGKHNVKIEGIQKDSQYIHLTDKKGHNLNDRLFDNNYLDSVGIDETTYPIIVNAYAAHKYHFKNGQTFVVDVSNKVDRYEQIIHKEKEYDNKVTFKIVGISQGTNNEAYYTTQEAANNILGLPNGNSWNKTHKFMMWSNQTDTIPRLADLAGLDAPESKVSVYSFEGATPAIDQTVDKLTGVDIPVGFNGIYTQNKEGKPLTAAISLYSYSGLYPGTSVFQSSGENKFKQILSYKSNLAIANMMIGGLEGVPIPSGTLPMTYYEACQKHLQDETWTGYGDYINEFTNVLSTVFGDTTMITSIAGAMDVAASDLVYSNLIATFDLAETSIMAIIIPITIIIVAVISNLIITDSKKMAAMMKALGYSDAKNLMSILALFVPTIVIGLALAFPLTLGLTLGYQSIIFNSANILVDVTQKWWYYVAAVGGIGVILIGTYGIGFVSLKKDRLVDQIK